MANAIYDYHGPNYKYTTIKTKSKSKFRSIFVTTRIAHANSLFWDLIEKTNYSNDEIILYSKARGNELNEAPCVVIELESLHKISNTKNYDLFVMDESESVLGQLDSSTMQANFHANIRVLEELTRNSKKVLIMDAYISDRSLRFVKELRDSDSTMININTYVT